MTARLRETYKNEVFKGMMEKYNYKNVMEVPVLEKITINMLKSIITLTICMLLVMMF